MSWLIWCWFRPPSNYNRTSHCCSLIVSSLLLLSIVKRNFWKAFEKYDEPGSLYLSTVAGSLPERTLSHTKHVIEDTTKKKDNLSWWNSSVVACLPRESVDVGSILAEGVRFILKPRGESRGQTTTAWTFADLRFFHEKMRVLHTSTLPFID